MTAKHTCVANKICQTREERKREVEEHVQAVKKALEQSGAIDPDDEEGSQDDESDEWCGFPDQPNLELVDHEEEYIDEDRYTTVTVESVSVSRDGFEKPVIRRDSDDSDGDDNKEQQGDIDTSKTKDSSASLKKKDKKKKFRYENKFDRKMTDQKQRSKNRRR